jgi:hypothetical protein
VTWMLEQITSTVAEFSTFCFFSSLLDFSSHHTHPKYVLPPLITLVPTMTAEKYKVADITLADFGRKEIEIAGTFTPL